MGFLDDFNDTINSSPITRGMNIASGTGLGIVGKRPNVTGSGGGPGLLPQNYLGSSTRQRSPEQIKAVNDRVVSLYGNNQAQDYLPTINNAYVNLGQPGMDTDREDTTGKFVTSLASTFADKFYEKTGNLPTEDQMRTYVAANANSMNASKFVQNQFNTDHMYANAEDYIKSNPDITKNPNADADLQKQMQGLNQQVTDLYGKAGESISNSIDAGFAEPRRQAISDEAALGRLRSPASIPNIAGVDTAREQAKGQAMAGLYGQQAGASLDIGKTVEGLLANERRAGEQVQQFGQSYGLANRKLADDLYNSDYTRGLETKKLDLAGQLGRQMADGQKNDGIGGALGGATSGASAGASFGPWGALIGGVGGGLMGYFGSKKG